MQNIKKQSVFLFIILLLFVFMTSLTYADTRYLNDGDSGSLLGSNVNGGFTAYASNYPQLNVNTSYEKCEISSSLNIPLGASLLFDGFPQILTNPTLRQIRIYDMNCDQINTITLNTDLVKYSITDINVNGQQEIAILGKDSIQFYEYNSTSEIFDKIVSYNTTTAGFTTNDLFECYRWLDFSQYDGSTYCTIFETNSRDILSIDFRGAFVGSDFIITPFATAKSNELSIASFSRGFSDLNNYNNIAGSVTHTDKVSNWYMFNCMNYASAGNSLLCSKLNLSGDEQLTFVISLGGLSNHAFDVVQSSIVRLGNTWRVVVHADILANGVSRKYVNAIFDLEGNIKYNYSSNTNATSNFAVIDVDKDGDNDACYLEDTYSLDLINESYLKCYDSNGNEVLDITIRDNDKYPMNMSTTLIMGDFVANNTYMGLATEEGIFYYNGTTFVPLIRSQETLSGGDGFGMTVIDFASSPAFIYSDENKGFILRNVLSLESCGNLICDGLENYFTCPVDCDISAGSVLNVTGSVCIKDGDCQYGVCEYGYCALGGTNAICTVHNDCVSGVCSNGKCTKLGLWESIDHAKDQHAGDSDDTNNFIALTIMIVITGLIIIAGKNITSILAGLIVFVGLAIFFAIVGWLSPFIFIGILFVGLVIGVLTVMMIMSG